MCLTDTTLTTLNSAPIKDYPGLRPWQPGQSGNPRGRPKGILTDSIRFELDRFADETYTNREAITMKLVAMARGGDIEAIKIVLDRIDGKVIDRHVVEGRIRIKLGWDNGDSD